MLKAFKNITFVIIIISFVFSGCSIFVYNKKQAQNMFNQALENFETIRSLEAKESYPDDFKQSQEFLNIAKKRLKIGLNTKAYLYASKSLEVSRKILRQFYLDTIASLAKKAKYELKKKTRGDIDNPLTDYISKLDRIAEYAKKIMKEPKLVSLKQVIDDLEDVLQITQSIKSNLSKTLDSDISFNKGEYTLSKQGVDIIKKFFDNFLINTSQSFDIKKLVFKVRVIGYTDQLNFSPDSPLIQKLSTGFEKKIPESDPEKRQFFNQHLSKLRAETIAGYIKEIFKNRQDILKLNLETLGRGEKIPANISPPYPVSDSRRRICKIHVYTINN